MAPLAALAVQVALDLDDRRNRVARLAEELHADRAGVLGHAVQHPARRGDQAVAAFLLHAGQAGRNLSVTSLPRPSLRNTRPAISSVSVLSRRSPGLPRPSNREFEARHVHVVDLAHVVGQARDFEPVAVRIDHAPPGQIVQRGAPQHGLLAARVHGDVAAHAGRLGRGRIHREHEAGGLGGLGRAWSPRRRRRESPPPARSGRAGYRTRPCPACRISRC